jgi:coenzyme F420-0:L-glutamate ligase / coenzyme F420-1:gamma-L-glutamate ligase
VNSFPVSRTRRKRVPPSRPTQSAEIQIIPIPFGTELRPNDSVFAELLRSMRERKLAFQLSDILVIKHKIISKTEGRMVDLDTVHPSAASCAWARKYNLDPRLFELAVRESRAIIRQKNGVLITETGHGFICANSGVDLSNVDGGKHALLLPEDPDNSARRLHREIKKHTGLAIPILITDTFGRPWREGLVDFCIGIAGMKPLRDYRGRRDPHGYELHASVEAVADELACAAGLVCGKLDRTPACVIRGFRYQPGRGRIRELLRSKTSDLFR